MPSSTVIQRTSVNSSMAAAPDRPHALSFVPPFGMCVGGASGAVLAYTNEPQCAVAMVTTNVESLITVDSISDVDDHGKIYRELTKRVTAYGIALMLSPEAQWLRSVIEVEEREWEV